MSENTPALMESELLKVASGLTAKQIQRFFSETPKNKIATRPAKGGGEWKYVRGSYVTQVLNSLFGFNWSFTIDTSMTEALEVARTGSVVVKGTLTVKVGDHSVTKEQYGRKEVAFKKGTKEPLDFGNDMKAAATDAKKKCAAELGLFADVYSQEDFFEAQVIDAEILEAEQAIAQAKTTAEVQKIVTKLSVENQKLVTETATVRIKELSDATKN